MYAIDNPPSFLDSLFRSSSLLADITFLTAARGCRHPSGRHASIPASRAGHDRDSPGGCDHGSGGSGAWLWRRAGSPCCALRGKGGGVRMRAGAATKLLEKNDDAPTPPPLFPPRQCTTKPVQEEGCGCDAMEREGDAGTGLDRARGLFEGEAEWTPGACAWSRVNPLL